MTASLDRPATGPDPEVDVATTDAVAPAGAAAFPGLDALPVDVVLDVVGITLAVALAVVVGADLDLGGRWPLSVAFFAWVPGWAVVRLAGFRASSLSLLVAVGLSTSITMLVGQVLVAWAWGAWRATTVVACLAVVGVLARDLRQAWT